MANAAQVTEVLNMLASEKLACPDDETRLRYGDYECPHCGADIEEHLRAFAQRLIEAAESVPVSSKGPSTRGKLPKQAPQTHEGISDRRM